MSFYSKIFLFFLFQSISTFLIPLRKGEERCLIDEFIENTYFVVKHKIFTEDKKDLRRFLPHIRFIIKEVDTNRMIFNGFFVNAKDKKTQKADKTGLYKVCICVNDHIPKEMSEMNIYANLKITSDNMDKNDYSNAIKTDDVDRMRRKADSIIRIINETSEKQKNQIKDENENSSDTLSNTRMYKYLNIGQIVVSIIIGLIQLNNFRKFLKSKNIV